MTNIILIVALTLWAEARGEGALGIRAVAEVIWNRSGHDPARLVAVCRAPKQFSCWSGIDPSKLIPVSLTTEREHMVWHDCVYVAELMVEGNFVAANRWDHYHRCDIMPEWALTMGMGCPVGNHVFYTSGRKW